MTFDQLHGGNLTNFYDLAEDPTRLYDLAGKPSANFYGLFHSSMLSGVTYTTGTNSVGAKLDLLEATPTRVRVRQEAFYQAIPASTNHLAGVKGIGDYSVYPERVAVRWNRRTTAAVPQTDHPLEIGVRREADARDVLTQYSQSGTTFPAPGDEDFVLAQREVAGVRTDFLAVMYADWPEANNVTVSTTATYFSWRDNPAVTPVPAGSNQNWNFLIYYKPTNFLDNTDTAVTYRSSDFRIPSGLSVGPGGPWQHASENTGGGDDFNEAEAAYALTLDPAAGLTFRIDGSATGPRYHPFFKIRQWRSLLGPPSVTLQGTALVRDVDYRAAVKPVSRAHFAQALAWHSTLQDNAAVNTPDVGGPGTVNGTTSYATGRYGSAALFDAAGENVTFGSGVGNFDKMRGAIEFWYQPNYAHTDGVRHVLWQTFGDATHYMVFEKTAAAGANQLLFSINNGGTLTEVRVASTDYRWAASEWVHLRATWDATAALTDQVRILVNRVEPPHAGPALAYVDGSMTVGTNYIGSDSTGTVSASGRIDEFHVYIGPQGPVTPATLAEGGLTSSANEFLGDPAKNATLQLAGVSATGQGRYLYLGADSQFRGLNATLAQLGAGVAADALDWEYWDGTQWASMESGFSFTDTTNSFTRAGNVHWTDLASWSLYSVNGGPDLYYVRAYMKAGATYTTPPIEHLIKTDILLFQYCGDIIALAREFVFAPPVPTAVKLQSFSAVPGDASVLLEWRTASELSNLGFHVYRAIAADGPWTRLNPSLIPGLGSSVVGQAYSFRDVGLVNETRYFYRLEDVDASSKVTSHGPVAAVPSAGAGAGTDGGGTSSGAGEKRKGGTSASCPGWVLAAYGSVSGASAATASLTCTRHGDPEAVSLTVLSRDTRQATLELRTGGFYALHTLSGAGEPAGGVRVFVPGFDFSSDPQAAALPFRRALVDAVVGRRVQLGGVRALEQVGFPGLVPSALGKSEMQVSWDGTVRAGRRAARAPAPRGVASDLVKLLPSVFQGETKSAVVEISPWRFDARRQQLVLAKRVRVRLLFTGRELAESGRASHGRRARGSRKPTVTGDVLARLYTKSLGLHAVSFDELFPGRRHGLAASELRLERQGQAVGFHLEPVSDSFGPGSRLFFHADIKAGSTDFSSETAWELLNARDGVRLSLLSAAPAGDPISSPSTGQASFETNRFYQPGLLDAPDLWLWEGLASGASRTVSFALGDVAASSSQQAELDVLLQGASESGSAIDHHVSVSVNGVPVGEAQFAGKRPYRMSLSVPLSLLREGANELGLANVPDTGVSSYVFLDSLAVSYPQTASLAGAVFEGTWDEGGTATVAGVAGSVALLDVTVGGTAVWLTGHEATGSGLRFRAEAGHRYLAVSDAGLLAPRVVAPAPSTLRSTQNQADYILIAARAFLAAAEPLLERRQDEGLQARAVSFEEIADAFGHGQASAEAIQGFLAYAFHSWARPSPRYVLLVGDSSYDPRNFTGTALASPLPALWTKTSYLWTVSDPELAAVNGEDALPDLAIGRLPATTVEEAQTLVQKLLAWEDSGQRLTGAATLVADNPDLAGDFETDVRDIAQSFLAERNPQQLLLRELGAGTRPAIRGALDSGLSFLNYVGHGGAAVWASENVWNSWDAASLQAQSQQPLLVAMNCLNGYFVAPAYNALAESLVKAEGRGAIAGFSPSGLSLDGPAHQYHRALMAEITGGQHERLGDALLAAQQAYAQTGLMPELLAVYHLLGDPATRIR
jgi:hypothetical protein